MASISIYHERFRMYHAIDKTQCDHDPWKQIIAQYLSSVFNGDSYRWQDGWLERVKAAHIQVSQWAKMCQVVVAASHVCQLQLLSAFQVKSLLDMNISMPHTSTHTQTTHATTDRQTHIHIQIHTQIHTNDAHKHTHANTHAQAHTYKTTHKHTEIHCSIVFFRQWQEKSCWFEKNRHVLIQTRNWPKEVSLLVPGVQLFRKWGVKP